MKEIKLKVKDGLDEYSISEAKALNYMSNILYTQIPIIDMFYARQIWLFNFEIHRFSDGEILCILTQS